MLIADLSSTWGVDYTDRTKRVWFRLPLAPGQVPPPRAAEPDRGSSDEPFAGAASLRLDDQGLLVAVDDTALSLLGHSRSTVLGRSLLSLCHPDDAGALASAAMLPGWQGSYRVRRGDGGFQRVQAHHVKFTGPQDAGDETLCILVDHRLRALLSDGSDAAAATAALAGPFATSPELLVRLPLDEVLGRTVA